jgi:hypothetical protein
MNRCDTRAGQTFIASRWAILELAPFLLASTRTTMFSHHYYYLLTSTPQLEKTFLDG